MKDGLGNLDPLPQLCLKMFITLAKLSKARRYTSAFHWYKNRTIMFIFVKALYLFIFLLFVFWEKDYLITLDLKKRWLLPLDKANHRAAVNWQDKEVNSRSV